MNPIYVYLASMAIWGVTIWQIYSYFERKYQAHVLELKSILEKERNEIRGQKKRVEEVGECVRLMHGEINQAHAQMKIIAGGYYRNRN